MADTNEEEVERINTAVEKIQGVLEDSGLSLKQAAIALSQTAWLNAAMAAKDREEYDMLTESLMALIKYNAKTTGTSFFG